MDKLLAEANRQIGELNAYSVLIPNVDLYIKMHIKIETNKSSRIEGTRTTVEEDLLDVTDVNSEKRESISMIALMHLNYWCNSENEKAELKNTSNNDEEVKMEQIKREKLKKILPWIPVWFVLIIIILCWLTMK